MERLRILYVEDNRQASVLNCLVLRELGYTVIEAFCAKEAVAIIEERNPLSALVTDINLGAGEDGFHIARCARGLYPDLPVVFVSAAAGSRFALEGVKDSVFIAKPFDPWQIAEALGLALPAAAA